MLNYYFTIAEVVAWSMLLRLLPSDSRFLRMRNRGHSSASSVTLKVYTQSDMLAMTQHTDKDTGQKKTDVRPVNEFCKEFLRVTDSETPSGRALFAFIRTQLKCFHLADYYSEHYILNEVYIRGQSKSEEIRD